MMLALGARLTLTNGSGKRKIDLCDFYKGYKTLDKSDSEILEWIEFDVPDAASKFNFEKVSKRTHLDIASVNSAIKIEVENGIISSALISAGGVAPIPLLLKETSIFLEGNEVTAEIIHRAIELAMKEISPISDIRGSSEYKSLLTAQMIKSHFVKLLPENILVEELL
jgi:xanthine dehydrogenase small subunit